MLQYPKGIKWLTLGKFKFPDGKIRGIRYHIVTGCQRMGILKREEIFQVQKSTRNPLREKSGHNENCL